MSEGCPQTWPLYAEHLAYIALAGPHLVLNSGQSISLDGACEGCLALHPHVKASAQSTAHPEHCMNSLACNAYNASTLFNSNTFSMSKCSLACNSISLMTCDLRSGTQGPQEHQWQLLSSMPLPSQAKAKPQAEPVQTTSRPTPNAAAQELDPPHVHARSDCTIITCLPHPWRPLSSAR